MELCLQFAMLSKGNYGTNGWFPSRTERTGSLLVYGFPVATRHKDRILSTIQGNWWVIRRVGAHEYTIDDLSD